MKARTGADKPGIPTTSVKPHLGRLILKRYAGRIGTGFDDLERFELIDRLEKPVLDFSFEGTKEKLLELNDLLSRHPYAYVIITKKGTDLASLPKRGVRLAWVYISRFPKLIEFIACHHSEISSDLWGLLYGYPPAEVHQFAYDWEAWDKWERAGRRRGR